MEKFHARTHIFCFSPPFSPFLYTIAGWRPRQDIDVYNTYAYCMDKYGFNKKGWGLTKKNCIEKKMNIHNIYLTFFEVGGFV